MRDQDTQRDKEWAAGWRSRLNNLVNPRQEQERRQQAQQIQKEKEWARMRAQRDQSNQEMMNRMQTDQNQFNTMLMQRMPNAGGMPQQYGTNPVNQAQPAMDQNRFLQMLMQRMQGAGGRPMQMGVPAQGQNMPQPYGVPQLGQQQRMGGYSPNSAGAGNPQMRQAMDQNRFMQLLQQRMSNRPRGG